MLNLAWKWPHRICWSPLVTMNTTAMARPSGFASTSLTVTMPTPMSVARMQSSTGMEKRLPKNRLSTMQTKGASSSLVIW